MRPRASAGVKIQVAVRIRFSFSVRRRAYRKERAPAVPHSHTAAVTRRVRTSVHSLHGRRTSARPAGAASLGSRSIRWARHARTPQLSPGNVRAGDPTSDQPGERETRLRRARRRWPPIVTVTVHGRRQPRRRQGRRAVRRDAGPRPLAARRGATDSSVWPLCVTGGRGSPVIPLIGEQPAGDARSSAESDAAASTTPPACERPVTAMRPRSWDRREDRRRNSYHSGARLGSGGDRCQARSRRDATLCP